MLRFGLQKVEVLSPPEHLQTEVVDDFDIEDEMQIQERLIMTLTLI